VNTRTVFNDLRSYFANVFFQKDSSPNFNTASLCVAAPCNYPGLQGISLEQDNGRRTERVSEKEKPKGRFNFLNILFAEKREERFRILEGEETLPTLVYRLGNLYHIPEDGRSRFSATRKEGMTYMQEEVWKYLKR
jgi:hypothetical protein